MIELWCDGSLAPNLHDSGGHPRDAMMGRMSERARKAKNKAGSAGSKITGFSIPFFGISWNPGVPDSQVAAAVLAYMENRRVLYNPIQIEDGNHCVISVVQIRDELTKAIQANTVDGDMLRQFREIRAACRKFCDEVDLGADVDEAFVAARFIERRGGGQDWVETFRDFRFNQAIGELRAAAGERLAAIAEKYAIDVEPELASIFPYPAD